MFKHLGITKVTEFRICFMYLFSKNWTIRKKIDKIVILLGAHFVNHELLFSFLDTPCMQ